MTKINESFTYWKILWKVLQYIYGTFRVLRISSQNLTNITRLKPNNFKIVNQLFKPKLTNRRTNETKKLDLSFGKLMESSSAKYGVSKSISSTKKVYLR